MTRVIIGVVGTTVALGGLLVVHFPQHNATWRSTYDSVLLNDLESVASTTLPALLYLAAGLVVLARQPGSRVGPLLVLTSLSQTTYLLVHVPYDWAVTAGIILFDVNAALVFHLLIAWPTGRTPSQFDRCLVVGVYAFAVTARTATTGLFDDTIDGNLLLWHADSAHSRIATTAVTLLLVPLTLACSIRVWRRWRSVSPADRRTMAPVVLGLPTLVALYAVAIPLHNLGFDSVALVLSNGVVWLAAYGALPAAFLYSALRLLRARGSVRAIAVDIGELPTLWRLEGILQVRLKDPNLQVLRYSSVARTFVDEDGRLKSTESQEGLGVTVLEEQGTPVAAVLHDPVLHQDAALISAITGAVRLALDSTRLREELHARGGDVARLPVGEVTLLFADIEGSTSLLDAMPQRYGDLLAELRSTAGSIVRRCDGQLVDAHGDEFFAAFADRCKAVDAALRIQQQVADIRWPEDAMVRLRVGLHRGNPQRTRDGYVGLDVHIAARVMAAAHGGEILASEESVGNGDEGGYLVERLGSFQLEGIRAPVSLVRVSADWNRTSVAFPPPRAAPAP